MKNRLNLRKPIGAMTTLDNMVSSNVFHSISKDDKYGLIIRELFRYHSSLKPKLPLYIYETFQVFAQHKRKISITFDRIRKHVLDKDLLDLIMDNNDNKENG